MTTATASCRPPTAWAILLEMLERAWNTICLVLVVLLVMLMV